jgi:raffinose/stachyose/melibiose transport system permease protein
MKRSMLGFWLFLMPTLLAFLAVVIVPMVFGFYYSFTDWNGIGNNPSFKGIENYIKIFTDDPTFWQNFLFTALFAVVTVVLVNIVGFGLALLVTQKFRGSKLMRAVFFMPNLIGGLLLGFTWQFIFVNIFEKIGKALDLPFLQGWLSTTETGFFGLVIVSVWQMAGYMMIIYIAALQSIPDSLLEAAEIDGANRRQRLLKITIPMIAPAFTICTFLTLSNSFKLFDQNLALTNGAPNNSTQMLALNIYHTAFAQTDLGLAQAKAIIFMLAVAAITLTQLYFNKKREVEL